MTHYPAVQYNCTFDCMWWMRCLPTSARTTEVTLGFCFPRETAARPDFRQEVQTYLRRWHLAVVEDNDISVNQQRGVESAMHEPGPFYVLREFGVHNFNNWLLDHMFPR